jgi:hypothetical protein
MEEQVERVAPGFRALIRKRNVMTPSTLEQHDQNLIGGSVNGGTAQIHQQLVFRPAPGLARPRPTSTACTWPRRRATRAAASTAPAARTQRTPRCTRWPGASCRAPCEAC